jgi:hypothetical protein
MKSQFYFLFPSRSLPFAVCHCGRDTCDGGRDTYKGGRDTCDGGRDTSRPYVQTMKSIDLYHETQKKEDDMNHSPRPPENNSTNIGLDQCNHT